LPYKLNVNDFAAKIIILKSNEIYRGCELASTLPET